MIQFSKYVAVAIFPEDVESVEEVGVFEGFAGSDLIFEEGGGDLGVNLVFVEEFESGIFLRVNELC